MRSQRPRGVWSAIGSVLGFLFFSVLAGGLVAVMIAPAVAGGSLVVSSSIGVFDSLPTYIEINAQAQQNRIFATKGGKPVQIATVYNQNRQEVTQDQVSQFALDAAVSGEDSRFYETGGIDVQGLVRAAVHNIATGTADEGASTITQQLVKNILIQQALTLPTPEARKAALHQAAGATPDRKLREMKLAIAMDKKYTKPEILLAYLNIAGFGGNTYGIQAAAEQFYNTDAKHLTVAQSASLIAIVQHPETRSLDDPANYVNNQTRRDYIITAMYTDGKITQAQRDEALATPVDKTTVTITEPRNGCSYALKYAKYFCDYIQKSVKDLTALGATPAERAENWQHGGYDVYTTLDYDLQTVAQQTSWALAPAKETKLKLGSSTVSVEVGTGRILVMAQNTQFDDTGQTSGRSVTSVNFSTDKAYGGSGGFQPGSTYKLFTLINWLQNGHGINESVDGSPRTVPQASFKDSCGGPWVGSYKFGNDEASEVGQFTVARATQKSINGAFVSMALELDLCDIANTARSLGVHRADGDPLKTNPSSVLGINEVAPISMSAAYAGIANSGTFCSPIAVDKIVGPGGVALPGQNANCHTAIDSDVADTAAYAMAGVVTGGTARKADPHDGTVHIAKTGTTDASNQTWIVGASRKVSTAVWVGNISGFVPLRSTLTNGAWGSDIRHDIWRTTMLAIDKKYKGGAFPPPATALLKGSGVTVPQLAGQKVETATAQLQVLGFTITVAGKTKSALPYGTVVRSTPAAGALASRGAAITVVTSDGSLNTMPNLVGLRFADAAAVLTSDGFLNVSEECVPLAKSGGAKDGTVVSSNPAASNSVTSADLIVLRVARSVCAPPTATPTPPTTPPAG